MIRKHALTLTSSPSMWRQCSLNLGNTCSRRALRSAALSAQRIESNFSRLRQEMFAVWAQGTKLISEYNCPFAYPLGWSTDRFSRRMIWRWVSSAPLWSAWQRMKAAVKTGKIKTDGGGKKRAWTCSARKTQQLLLCAVGSLPSCSAQEIQPSHVYRVASLGHAHFAQLLGTNGFQKSGKNTTNTVLKHEWVL